MKDKGKGTKRIKNESFKDRSGFIFKGLILGCRRLVRRRDGSFFGMRTNRVILLSDS